MSTWKILTPNGVSAPSVQQLGLFTEKRTSRKHLLLRMAFCFVFSALNVIGQEQSPPTSVAMEAIERLKGIDLEANPAVKNAVLKILEQVKGTPQFVKIVRDFKISGLEPALLEFAAKQPDSYA